MEMNTTVNNGQVIINLSGRIHVEEATILRENLLVLMESGHKEFVIKLKFVEYIDSSGLSVLVAIHTRALKMRGSVTLIGACGLVKELFELTRLNKVFAM